MLGCVNPSERHLSDFDAALIEQALHVISRIVVRDRRIVIAGPPVRGPFEEISRVEQVWEGLAQDLHLQVG